MQQFEVNFILNGIVRSEYFYGELWKDIIYEFNKKYPGKSNTVEIFGWRIIGKHDGDNI